MNTNDSTSTPLTPSGLAVTNGSASALVYRWPDHVPAPLDGYEFSFYGTMIYSFPPCSLWHRFIFRLPSALAWKIYRPNAASEPRASGANAETPVARVAL